MRKIYAKLRKVNSRIADCEHEAQAVSRLPFYSLFGREAQRKNDLERLQELKESLLREKLQLLSQLRYMAKQEAKLIVSTLS